MESRKSGLLNPKNWVWHHPANNADVMQLIPRTQHANSLYQSILHPGGRGGYSIFY